MHSNFVKRLLKAAWVLELVVAVLILAVTLRAVTDVLLFAIARQLVVNHSSAVDTLLGVAAVALIFVIKKFLHTDGDDAPAGDGRP